MLAHTPAAALPPPPPAAHVAANATTVYVRKPGSAKKWLASVVCLARPSDLALLTVGDDAFWEPGLAPLTFSPLPELQAPIAVAGYPMVRPAAPAVPPAGHWDRCCLHGQGVLVHHGRTLALLQGGDSLCVTQGIVSRVSMVHYSASGKLLGVQVDSAINPGARARMPAGCAGAGPASTAAA